MTMTDREKVILGMKCCMHMLTDSGESHCQDCPYNDLIMNHGCDNPVYCIKDYVRDALKLLQPRLLKWTEVDQFDVVYIEVHEDEEGLGEWSGYGSYEHQGPDPGTLQFAVIGKSMRLATDPQNYNIYWRCWSSKPDRDQMESTPWKDPY